MERLRVGQRLQEQCAASYRPVMKPRVECREHVTCNFPLHAGRRSRPGRGDGWVPLGSTATVRPWKTDTLSLKRFPLVIATYLQLLNVYSVKSNVGCL